jgi:hypothetical protein
MTSIDVYLEAGKVRTFAVVPAWPGWCRSGKGEDAALAALIACGPRYARALQGEDIAFDPPASLSALRVVDWVMGNATTDFGAPDLALPTDAEPVDGVTLTRYEAILRASWVAFDSAAAAAEGKTLTTGPRGGGRSLDRMVEHVRMVDDAYLSALGGRLPPEAKAEAGRDFTYTREAILAALADAVSGRIPPVSPRGRVYWSPHYFVRRLAWHELDHAWELEDRIVSG